MPAYRIEIASTGRAGCNATQCKKNNVKIAKGEMRQGVWVDYEDRGSYKWRHWGCITPEVLHNWHAASEGNTDMIDGFDELPEAAQEKLQRALEQGHVDDEDWNGDIECNRWSGEKGMGMFVKGAAKKKKDAEEADANDESQAAPAKKPAGKKRKVAKAELDDEDGEVPSKGKGKGKMSKIVADDDEDDVEVPAPKRSRSKKAKIPADEEESAPAKAPVAKKGRGKKAAPVEQVDDEGVDEATEPELKPATTKRGRKKAANDDAEDAVKPAPKPKPQKRKTKATKAAEED